MICPQPDGDGGAICTWSPVEAQLSETHKLCGICEPAIQGSESREHCLTISFKPCEPEIPDVCAFQRENIQSNNTGVDAIFSNLSKVVKFILINFNDDCAFFTEDASSLKKLSIELPSKIFLLNPTTKPVAYSKSE